MRILDGIRAIGTQRFRTTGYENQTIEIVLYYLPAISRWKMDIESGDFVLNGIRIDHHPNLLVQYKNVVEFGISCIVTTDKGEPFLVNDFSSGRCQLVILSKEEVEAVEETLFEG